MGQTDDDTTARPRVGGVAAPEEVRRGLRRVILVFIALMVTVLVVVGIGAVWWLGGDRSEAQPEPAPKPTDGSVQSLPDPPASARNCVRAPSDCGYPDASTTGVDSDTQLIRVPEDSTQGDGWRYENGIIRVDGEDAVVENLSTAATIEVYASGVTVRNCRIEVTGERWGVGLRTGKNIVVEQNTITSPVQSGPRRLATGIYQMEDAREGMVARRNDISHTSTGIIAEGGLVEGNYIHDLGMKEGDHLNGLSSNGGSQVPLVIRGNTILNQEQQTDAIALFTDFGPQNDRLVQNNLIGGGGYTLYADSRGGSNVVVEGNRFSQFLFEGSGFYGPVAAFTDGPGNVFRDNVYDVTGIEVPPRS